VYGGGGIVDEGRGTSYDEHLPDQGLGVWHIMEDPAVYNSAPPPSTVSMSDWTKLGSANWGRKAIRMVRPIITPPLEDGRALWDASDYSLALYDPNPLHSSLRWGDGTPSGFAVHHLATPQADFSLSIDAPLMQ